MLLLIAAHTLISSLLPPPGLSGADVGLLLEIGVGEQEIIRLADRMGGFEPLDAERYAMVESYNPSVAFLQRLPRVVTDFGAISELARKSEVFQDDRLGLGFVYPAGWAVTRSAAGKGGTILRIAPRSASDPRVFVSPCVFVFVQEKTAIVPDAADPLLQEIRQIVVRKLRAAGLRPAAGPSGSVQLLGSRRETASVGATVDGDAGVLDVAFAIDAKGRAIGVGFTASAADRAKTAEAFSRLAESLVFH